jgi:hypothetical protein
MIADMKDMQNPIPEIAFYKHKYVNEHAGIVDIIVERVLLLACRVVTQRK